MKLGRLLGRFFLIGSVAFGATQAMGEGSYEGETLVQVGFDRLIPSSYPVIVTRFDALEPTSYPVIYPGIAHVPITESLVRPMEQPLLLTN